jgi:hypothetical protein
MDPKEQIFCNRSLNMHGEGALERLSSRGVGQGASQAQIAM